MLTPRPIAILIALALLSANDSPAAPADLDSTFATGGIYTDPTVISDFGVVDTEIQPDGKILTVSATGAGIAGNDIRVNRYNTDGTPDTSFDGDGLKVIDLGGFDYANDILVLADGKILLAGNTKILLRRSRFLLIRLESDGDLDPTFGGGDGWVANRVGYGDAYGYSVALRADGRILVGGKADADGTAAVDDDFALARYRPAGRRDRRFGFDNPASANPLVRLGWTTQSLEGTPNEKAVTIWALPGGRILAAGQTQIGLDMFFALARFDSLGFLDPTFATGGHTTVPAITTYADIPHEAVRQADGKIVIAGETFWDTGVGGRTDKDFGVVRLNPDGTLDSTFAGDGTTSVDFSLGDDVANSIALDECGRIVLAGQATGATDIDFAVARLEPDGTLDTTFGSGGKYVDAFGAYNEFFHSVAVQPLDGRIVLGGLTVNDAFYNWHTTVIERLLGGGVCTQPVP